MIDLLSVNDIERFWSNVYKHNQTGCWEYVGHKLKEGRFSLFYYKDRCIFTHRLSYFLITGVALSKGQNLLFFCGNPLCINPNHATIARKRKPIEDRFWQYVKKAKVQQCWMWLGGKDKDGYGRLRSGREGSYKAHRYSYELHNGPIPEKLNVLHRCDNPSCVSPKHLFVGTHKDNTQDMIKKGRDGFRLNKAKGERHPHHKLTWEQVNEIRAVRSDYSVEELAAHYRVTSRTIYSVRNYETWKVEEVLC